MNPVRVRKQVLNADDTAGNNNVCVVNNVLAVSGSIVGPVNIANDDNDRHTRPEKPTLLRFKGAENVIYNVKLTTPLEHFELLFDGELVDHIIECTLKNSDLLYKGPKKSPKKNSRAQRKSLT